MSLINKQPKGNSEKKLAKSDYSQDTRCPIDVLEVTVFRMEKNLKEYASHPNAKQGYINRQYLVINPLRYVLKCFSLLRYFKVWIALERKMESLEQADPNLSGHHIYIKRKPGNGIPARLDIDLSYIKSRQNSYDS